MEQVFSDPYVDIVIFVLLCVGLIALVLGVSTLRGIGLMNYREASRIGSEILAGLGCYELLFPALRRRHVAQCNSRQEAPASA